MSTLYSEIDPFAAAWLRELCNDGHITPGTVNETSITDLSSESLGGHDRVHLFAGIGGWDLALQLAGWPANRPVWSGSCPCQPYSVAGKRKGKEDSRDLWPDMRRLIAACRPEYVFGEQVPGAIGHGWLDRVQADLEAEGYQVGAVVLGAHSVGAPHIRQRLYWVAYARVIESGERRVTDLLGRRQNDTEQAGMGGEFGGLADSEHLRTGSGTEGGQGPERERRDRPAIGGAVGGLPDSACGGAIAAEQPGCGHVAVEARGRLEHSPSDGRTERRTESGGGIAAGGCGDDGMEFSESQRLQGPADCGDPTGRHATERLPGLSGGTDGPWSNSYWHPCRDPKRGIVYRRVPREAEPGVQFVFDGLSAGVDESGRASRFPLTARKIEGRVGILKGAGNAIVPAVAAVFIRAVMTQFGVF